MIAINGKIIAQGSQFSMHDVEVITAIVNLEDVRQYRGGIASRGIQAANSKMVMRINCDFALTSKSVLLAPSSPIEPKYHKPVEEIAFGPACWLWDYLRRSGMKGFFLPLSGGADSSATATMVGIMCKLLIENIEKGNQIVINDVRRIANYKENEFPKDSRELASRIFVTCYMATKHSSTETNLRSKALAHQIGSYHINIEIDPIIAAIEKVFETQQPTPPHVHPSFGATPAENLALQNIQARSRMVMSYFLAQLSPWSRGLPGSLLVLGSANVAEALRGYFTKYDCSSADINPIGGISKGDLKQFLYWAASAESGSPGYTILKDVADATPSAELTPVTQGQMQKDEEDMGMTYAELERYGALRKIEFCGPISMFRKLACEWPDLPPSVVAEKVKHFFRMYAINRHKLTTLTPSYHAENYSPDDNRYDLRPFLYPSRWEFQFEKIDQLVAQMEEERKLQQVSVLQTTTELKRKAKDDDTAPENSNDNEGERKKLKKDHS
jgi:NAD+ synthase (glutamine-hydrolysing)